MNSEQWTVHSFHVMTRVLMLYSEPRLLSLSDLKFLLQVPFLMMWLAVNWEIGLLSYKGTHHCSRPLYPILPPGVTGDLEAQAQDNIYSIKTRTMTQDSESCKNHLNCILPKFNNDKNNIIWSGWLTLGLNLWPPVCRPSCWTHAFCVEQWSLCSRGASTKWQSRWVSHTVLSKQCVKSSRRGRCYTHLGLFLYFGSLCLQQGQQSVQGRVSWFMICGSKPDRAQRLVHWRKKGQTWCTKQTNRLRLIPLKQSINMGLSGADVHVDI